MIYKKLYITSQLISNNIFYNFYLLSNIFFPKYFKDRIIKIKELNDSHYNNLQFLLYTEEIYEKYDIDLMKFKDMYYEFINKYKNKDNDMNDNDDNDDNDDNNDDDDKNSIKTLSLISSCSSLNSSFYDEIEEE
jgi:hypothetical protein